jgi:hypothetical protein
MESYGNTIIIDGAKTDGLTWIDGTKEIDLSVTPPPAPDEG